MGYAQQRLDWEDRKRMTCAKQEEVMRNLSEAKKQVRDPHIKRLYAKR